MSKVQLIKSTEIKYDTNSYKAQTAGENKSFILPVMEEKIYYPKLEGIENQFEYQVKKVKNEIIQFNSDSVKIPVIKTMETLVKYSKENEKIIKKSEFDYATSGIAFGQLISEKQYLSQISNGINSSPDVEKLYQYGIEESSNSITAIKVSNVNTDFSATKLSGIPSELKQPDRWISIYTGDLLRSINGKGIETLYAYNDLGMLTEKKVRQSNTGQVLSKQAYQYRFASVSSINSQPTTYKVIEQLNDKNANIQWLDDQGKPLYVYEHSINNDSQGYDGWLDNPSASASYLNNGQVKRLISLNEGKKKEFVFQYDEGLMMNEKSSVTLHSKQPLDKLISLKFPEHNIDISIHLVEEKLQEIILNQLDSESRSNHRYTVLGGPEYKYFEGDQEHNPNTKITGLLSLVQENAGWDNHELLYDLLHNVETINKLKKYAIHHELNYQDNIGRNWRSAKEYKKYNMNGEPESSHYLVTDSKYDFRGNLVNVAEYTMDPQPTRRSSQSLVYIDTNYAYDQYNNIIELSKTDKGKSGKKYVFAPKIIYSAGGFVKQDQEGVYEYCEDNGSGCILGEVKSRANLDGGVVKYSYNINGMLQSVEIGDESTNYYYTSGDYPKISSIENDISRHTYGRYNYIGVPSEEYQEFSPDGKTLFESSKKSTWKDDGNISAYVNMLGADNKHLHYYQNYTYNNGNVSDSSLYAVNKDSGFPELSTSYFYDDLDRVITEQKKDLTINYVYDSIGKQTSVKSVWHKGESSLLAEYNYNREGLLNTRIYTLSDKVLGNHKRIETYLYSKESQIIKYTCKIVDGSKDFCPSEEHGRPIKSALYEYDIINNLTSIKFNYIDGTENIATYSYDSNQPDQMATLIYTKVPNGVTSSNEFEYNKNGQAIYHHDKTSFTQWNPKFYKAKISYKADGKVSRYQYENLVNKTQNNFLFKYDINGNQIAEQINGNVNMVSYFDNNNLMRGRYYPESKSLQVFGNGYMINFSLSTYKLEFKNTNTAISDGNSIIGNLDVDGKLSSFNVYSPFGVSTNVLSKLSKYESDKNNQSPYGYNSELTNSETNWQYLGTYRTYTPAFRHFLQHDSWSPFGDGGVNGYAYANNNPINYYDPSGHVTHLNRFLAHLFQGIGYTILGVMSGSHGLLLSGVGCLVEMGYDISNAGQDGWGYDDGVSQGEFAAMETGQLAANFIGLGIEKSMYRLGGKIARHIASTEGKMSTQFAFNILGGVVSSPAYSAPYLINEARKGNDFDSGKFWGEMALSGLTTGFIETGPNKLLDEGFTKVSYKGFAHDTQFKRKWWGGFAESVSTKIEKNQYFKFAFNADHLRMIDARGTALQYYKSRMRAALISRINYFLIKDSIRNFTDAFYGWKEKFYQQLR